jgi:hypothetical protein
MLNIKTSLESDTRLVLMPFIVIVVTVFTNHRKLMTVNF